MSRTSTRAMTRVFAKHTLKARGWSYRRAAPQLGVTYQHLSEVLNGKRNSRRLLAKIEQLPDHARAA